MALIELKDYVLKPEMTGKGKGIGPLTLNLEQGVVYLVKTDSANDAHLFFKGLATLAYPSSGSYRYNGETLDFSDYRRLLWAKKTMGYLTSDTALISNRSIRENLILGRSYFENDLSLALDSETMALCVTFGIERVLDQRPANLGVLDNKCAMMVREIAKKPKIMLLEYPEEFCLSEGNSLEVLIETIKKRLEQGMALVFLTYEEDFSRCFSGKTLEISDGRVREIVES
jgi:ABC-type lipoprotein export system ATPase subunit